MSFIYAAEEESIGKAARALHISQSAVSQHIAKLEDEYGVILFTRTKHGVYLTNAGRILLSHATRIRHEYDETARRLWNWLSGLGGPIQIGTEELFGACVLPRFLASLRLHYPDTEALVQVGDQVRLIRRLKRRSLDVAILEANVSHDWPSPSPSHQDLVAVPIMKGKRLAVPPIVQPQACGLVQKTRVTSRSITRAFYLVSHRRAYRPDMVEWFVEQVASWMQSTYSERRSISE